RNSGRSGRTGRTRAPLQRRPRPGGWQLQILMLPTTAWWIDGWSTNRRWVGMMTGRAHVVTTGEGRAVDLGVARMRGLAGEAGTRAFSLTEFEGEAEGPWTIPHMHHGFEESFFVLDGEFTFTIGGESIVAGPGTYLLVPKDTAHTIAAGPGGGRFLTLMVPG